MRKDEDKALKREQAKPWGPPAEHWIRDREIRQMASRICNARLDRARDESVRRDREGEELFELERDRRESKEAASAARDEAARLEKRRAAMAKSAAEKERVPSREFKDMPDLAAWRFARRVAPLRTVSEAEADKHVQEAADARRMAPMATALSEAAKMLAARREKLIDVTFYSAWMHNDLMKHRGRNHAHARNLVLSAMVDEPLPVPTSCAFKDARIRAAEALQELDW